MAGVATDATTEMGAAIVVPTAFAQADVVGGLFSTSAQLDGTSTRLACGGIAGATNIPPPPQCAPWWLDGSAIVVPQPPPVWPGETAPAETSGSMPEGGVQSTQSAAYATCNGISYVLIPMPQSQNLMGGCQPGTFSSTAMGLSQDRMAEQWIDPQMQVSDFGQLSHWWPASDELRRQQQESPGGEGYGAWWA